MSFTSRIGPPSNALNLDANDLLTSGRLKERQYHLVEVDDERSRSGFLYMPRMIYRNDPAWVEPLHNEITTVFDKERNSYFDHGECKRWILATDDDKIIGRIAAFIDYNKWMQGDEYIGGIGFFECINDDEAANILFNRAEQWLRDKGCNAIQGPINFGENDKFWGLLTWGFEMPTYGMNYNPPYYQKQFESYGFKPSYNQITTNMDLTQPLPERFERIANRVLSNDHYDFAHFQTKYKDKFINDFITIYNQAWASFDNFHPIGKDYLERSFDEMKPIMVEEFIWFAYADGEPAGFLITTPDVNPILKHLHGRMNWINKIKFLYLKKTKGFSRARGNVMGIVPQHQRHGLESGLIFSAIKEGRKRPEYKSVELAWVGDFNDKMLAIHKALGAEPYKKHVTYKMKMN